MITLEVKQLQKLFGPKTIFSNVSFIHQQGVLGIAGSNGTGKSTLLKCLAHLIPPTHGEIIWENEEEDTDSEALKKRLGYAAPYVNLYEGLSCNENLEFLAKIRHEPSFINKIDYWLHKVELNHVSNQAFGKLSSGQQQRLQLAAALFHDPDVILFDEPGSNLDESGQILIQSIVTEFKKANKLTILASNNPDELKLCDQVYSVEMGDFL